MTASRLSLALDRGAVALPGEGPIAVIGPGRDADLSALDPSRVRIVQGFRPDHDAWAARGYEVAPEIAGPYAAAVVFVPRSKAEARDQIARAVAATDGPVIVDGQKTDGIDSLLRDIRGHGAEVGEALAKSHGKIFEMRGGDFAAWRAPDRTPVAEGMVTAPGVFSADGPDPGSVLLADTLPARLAGIVADLGAGWGYLARAILTREGVEALHLVEADHAALSCARENVTDPRAVFHWADATAIRDLPPLDAVVTNPPFHTSRAADPALGAAFVEAARRLLKPSGQLWLVANRHLPYERTLNETFQEVRVAAEGSGYKVIHAARPRRKRV